jgi:hypothetical protein
MSNATEIGIFVAVSLVVIVAAVCGAPKSARSAG